ncbi:MAG: hypothetical protein MO846_04715 [Candidatus Devosia symbiotica]|nr:hypothetical protein [Candidatus Devosia symbiotica]
MAGNGIGQFKINLLHSSNALKMADDAVLFKRIVKGATRKHKRVATLMAKAYGGRSGNGFYVHFSLNDTAGVNVFDDDIETGSDVMLNVVAGLLASMAESTLLFASHFNPYRRLHPDIRALSAISWRYKNRTTMVDIPSGNLKARRIGHRVSGADANPYAAYARA